MNTQAHPPLLRSLDIEDLERIRQKARRDPAAALDQIDRLAAAHPRNHWLPLKAVLLSLQQGRLRDAWDRLDRIAHSSDIPAGVLGRIRGMIEQRQAAGGYPDFRVNRPEDYYRHAPAKGFLPQPPRLQAGRGFPSGFPFEMAFPDIVGTGNDFRFIVDAAHQRSFGRVAPAGRVHVVADVDSADELTALLAALEGQSWPADLLRLTVCCPGPIPAPRARFALRCVETGPFWQLDRDRQIALAAGDAEVVLFLSGATRPGSRFVELVGRYFMTSDALLLVPVAETPTALAESQVQRAWQRERMPFRKVRSLDFAIAAERFRALGGFDPRFRGPGLAASELAYRFCNGGGWIMPVPAGGAVAAPSRVPGEDGALFRQLSPNHWDRKTDGRFEIPKVSIYIPAYRAGRYIVDAVDSVLSQDFEDLEVCIADDGSPDDTLRILERHYGDQPRVRWVSGRNGGIGHGSNAALALARGMYIGQLDSDDRLKPGAVRRLASHLDENAGVVCAYSSCERIDAGGNYLRNEYSFPTFSREKMMMTSIAHHFRMFRRQAWERTGGFRSDIVNAVDYDMFLKLSETGEFQHVREMLYQRRWHGENTSNVNEDHQTRNTHVVQTKALQRMGLDRHWQVHVPNPAEPRRITYRRPAGGRRVFFWPDYTRSNPYQRLLYARASESVEFIGADLDAALKAAKDAIDPTTITFHLHWLNKVFAGIGTAAAAEAAAAKFLDGLGQLKRLKARLVWTVHNLVSHDMPWRETELRLARGIAALADAVHLHSAGSAAEIEPEIPLAGARIVVSRHGHYNGYYPDFVDRGAARAMLGLGPDETALLFLGQIRPYKGLDVLIRSFRDLRERRPGLRLVLAGKGDAGALPQLLDGLSEAERSRILCFDRYIDDMELQMFFRAADLAVFPYRQILTSGSLLLALSFGTPAVIPANAMTREVLDGTGAGVLYDGAGGAAALGEAIGQALAAEGDTAMRQAALARAEALDWPDVGPVLFGEGRRDPVGGRYTFTVACGGPEESE